MVELQSLRTGYSRFIIEVSHRQDNTDREKITITYEKGKDLKC